MTALLEIREKIKMIYSKNEVFIIPIAKFLLTFIVLTMVNGKIGYMGTIDKMPVVLIASLFCSFLPVGFIIVFAALFSLLHMYALSLEVALVGLCLYLIMFLLFFRFSPRDSMVVILTPMLFMMKIPYIMPIVVGLLGTPASVVSVACGVVIYFFLNHVVGSAAAIGSMEPGEMTAKLRLMIDGILKNREMLVVIAAFAVAVIVVYMIRRMSIDYAWTIAMVAGGIANLVVLLVGDLVLDTNVSVLGAILGTILAVAVAKVVEFFRFCVDYSRTEKVQFEDDEYYYYVKAVPKMTVAVQTKTVKKINTQSRPAQERTVAARSGSASHTVRSREGYRTPSPAAESARTSERNVVTERTSYSRGGARSANVAVRTNVRQNDAVESQNPVDDLEIEELE